MKTHSISTLLWTVAGCCLSVQAQTAPNAPEQHYPLGTQPVPINDDAGAPDAGKPSGALFGDRQFFDVAQRSPTHPPLEEIPPMPMPYGDDEDRPSATRWEDANRTMSFYDSETGEWYDIPVRMPAVPANGQSPDGDYWGVAPLDASEEYLRGFGSMVQAGSLDSWPRSGNVKLAMRFTDQNGITRWYVCSGTMVDPGVVLTAAHCVYARSPNGINIFDWAEEVFIYPGWDGNGAITPPGSTAVHQNFGYARGTQYIAGTNYINSGDFDSDLGLVRIQRGTSRNVGMLTGWFGYAWGQSCGTIQGRSYGNFSYPAEFCGGSLHTGRTMYYWSGVFDSCPGNQLRLDTVAGCLTTGWGGMSGSGAYYTIDTGRFVHAVSSNGNRADRTNYAKLWDTFVDDLVTFQNNTRTNSEDWEPLMLRARGSTTVRAGTAMNDSLDVRMVNATNANPPARDYTVRVYLSTNSTISAADTLLATWNWNNRDFDAMANVNFNVPAPSIPIDTPAGSYWLGVIIDGGLPGTTANDATDSWDAQPITVTIGLPATAAGPSPAHNSTNRGINTDLAWGSAARASSYRVHFGTTNNPPQIASTSSTFRTLSPLLHDTQYYWRIDTVNSAGVTTGPLWTFRTEPQPRPDLDAEVSDAPSGSFYRGTSINVFHRTRNIGNQASTGTAVEFRASTNNIISTADRLMQTNNFVGIASGGVLQTTTSVQIPPDLNPGTYYIGTRVSEPNNNEPSFANNWVSDTNTITVLACTADLAPPYGQLNIFDLTAYLTAYGNSDPAADLAPPFGVLNIFDLTTYLAAYNAGCP